MIKVKYHPELAAGRWTGMPLAEQMANIGSEVHRTRNFMLKGNNERARVCFERGLELIDLSIDARPRPAALRELCRARECFCAAFTDRDIPELAWLDKYFYAFALEYAGRQATVRADSQQ